MTASTFTRLLWLPTFQMMGADRMILISDSMRATGMLLDGQYNLGGLDVKRR